VAGLDMKIQCDESKKIYAAQQYRGRCVSAPDRYFGRRRSGNLESLSKPGKTMDLDGELLLPRARSVPIIKVRMVL
jgi:hypothetical protein